MEREAAVSELVSALLLTAVIVAGAAVVLSGITSQYPPVKLPGSSFEIWNESQNILIQSTGGDPLPEGNYSVRVYNDTHSETWLSNNTSIRNTMGNNSLFTGNTLDLPSVMGSSTDTRVQVIYRHKADSEGRSVFEAVMYEKKLW